MGTNFVEDAASNSLAFLRTNWRLYLFEIIGKHLADAAVLHMLLHQALQIFGYDIRAKRA